MKKQVSDEDVSLSDLVGSSLAIVQHGIDLAVTGLFRRLKQNAEPSTKKKKRKTSTPLGYVADFTRGFIGFIGQTGDSYMSTYEDLKKGKKE